VVDGEADGVDEVVDVGGDDANRPTCGPAAAASMFLVPVTFTGKNGPTAGEAPIRPAAWMTTWQPRTAPGAGCHCGTARVVLVRAVPGEGFDRSAEVMAGRALDHGAFDGPVGGVHGEPARQYFAGG
jgi:hypothetical protein